MGLLQEKPMHPYEIGRTLRERGQDASVKLRTGSLYDMVAALVRDGWIEPVHSIREGGHPERTVYRQTEQGQHQFVAWLNEVISTPAPEYPAFLSAIAYLGVLGKDGAITALGSRIERLAERIHELESALSEAMQTDRVPRLFMIEVEYALAMLDAERNWARHIAEQMTTGELPWPVFVDTKSGPAWIDGPGISSTGSTTDADRTTDTTAEKK